MKLTVIVHTYNSAQTLERLLESLKWVDEIIVVDMHSQDRTTSIAERFGARILFTEKVQSVDSIRNNFLEEAAHSWILVMDSDEYLADDAADQITKLIGENGNDYDAFAFPRHNRIGDAFVRGSGWYPDYQTRLFRKGTVRWADGFHKAPEVVSGPARLCVLEPPDCIHIHHQNYSNLRHFIQKQLDYSLHDTYPNNPEEFSYREYVGRAHVEFARRHDTENDGDLSHALAAVMGWDQVMRGLIHWDQLDPKPSLEDAFSLPVVCAASESVIAENRSLKERLAHEDRQIGKITEEMEQLRSNFDIMRNSLAMRTCRRLDPVLLLIRRASHLLSSLFRHNQSQ